MKKRVSRFMVSSACPTCHGKRLKREALSVTFAGLDIAALSQMPMARVAEILRPVARGELSPDVQTGEVLNKKEMREAVERRVASGGSAHKASPDIRRTTNQSREKQVAAQRMARELLERLSTLIDLGLGYLALDRSTPTLSSGELQRLRLATQLASQLFGVIYVLDEPSAGLHPADGEALYSALQRLKEAGNSLFVVEHDLEMMRRADWLVDVGPAAGTAGGSIVYSGPPAGLADVEASQTRLHLFGEQRPVARAKRSPAGWLRLANVTRNNLEALDIAFPLRCFTTVTGVSGSGKSSLVSQALPELVAEKLGRTIAAETDEERDPLLDAEDIQTDGEIVEGMEHIRRLVKVDQKPIGRTPRSNLATYTGLFDHVRKLFAHTPQARQRRYDAGRFSFNVVKGRCPTCEGEGFVSVELLFMPSVYAPCSTCGGTRYNPETLEVTWNQKNIAEVLQMTVDTACEFFVDEPQIMRALTVLRDIGLGYLRLGQPATELSGGEAQRIKLATELQRAQRGESLYILDEPTTGLHSVDSDRLLIQLQGLVDAGNTVIVVEHDMRVAAQSDWVIDMGPGAGENGGKVVASGTPEDVVKKGTRGQTSKYLEACLT
jgi:excinuclease ABC subunit A